MGDNSKASIITRGLAETMRLGLAVGGEATTFSGLAGVGDLIATCMSPLSRNHSFGVRLGQGMAVEDPGQGLDSAVAAGAAAAHTGRVAVVLADHPALRPEEVRIALAATELLGAAVIADADHDGTALLTLPGGPGARTAFGPGSAAAHERLGHTRLHLDLPGLLRDVDDAASLAAAVRLGVGPHTAQALTRATLPGMQATIHSMAEDGSGSALLDDGVEVALPAGSAVSAGLRHLRVGQRVSIELDEEGQRAVRVWIVGIGPGESIA
ncbi:MAG: NAD(P)H-dependent glycerol-3-phosphate dehydrogenase, partial [Ornithinibacter sp.]